MTNTANIGGHRFFTPASGSSNAPGQVAQADTGVTDRLLNFGKTQTSQDSEDPGVTDRLLKFGSPATQPDDQGVTDRLLKFGAPAASQPVASQGNPSARDNETTAAIRAAQQVAEGSGVNYGNEANNIFLGNVGQNALATATPMAVAGSTILPAWAALPRGIRAANDALSSVLGAYQGYESGGLRGAIEGGAEGGAIGHFGIPAFYNLSKYALPLIPPALAGLIGYNALNQSRASPSNALAAP